MSEPKKHKAILMKLETHDDAEIPNKNGDGVRKGFFYDKPEVGLSFTLFNEDEPTRGLRTSFIKEILEEDDDHVKFKTNNSIYYLELF